MCLSGVDGERWISGECQLCCLQLEARPDSGATRSSLSGELRVYAMSMSCGALFVSTGRFGLPVAGHAFCVGEGATTPSLQLRSRAVARATGILKDAAAAAAASWPERGAKFCNRNVCQTSRTMYSAVMSILLLDKWSCRTHCSIRTHSDRSVSHGYQRLSIYATSSISQRVRLTVKDARLASSYRMAK